MAKKKVFNIGSALSNGLKETITAAHHYAGELRVEVIPIKKIELDPNNPRDFCISFDDLYHKISMSDPSYIRKTKEKESLGSLAVSIKEQGVLNPIIVYKNDEKYRLIAGERRTLASIIAGKHEIQAKILDTRPTELKISILQWIENIERSDLTLWERLKNLEKIVSIFTKNKGISISQLTITELSHLIGCTKPHAMNYKAVLTGDSKVQGLVQENKIKNLEKAALLSNIEDPSLRERAIQACLEGADLKKLKLLVKFGLKTHYNQGGHKERRGRRPNLVNFGSTKNIAVARLIIDSVLKNCSLAYVADHFIKTDWDDHKSMTEAFREAIKQLEKLNT